MSEIGDAMPSVSGVAFRSPTNTSEGLVRRARLRSWHALPETCVEQESTSPFGVATSAQTRTRPYHSLQGPSVMGLAELLGYAAHDAVAVGGGYLGMVHLLDPIDLLGQGRLQGCRPPYAGNAAGLGAGAAD